MDECVNALIRLDNSEVAPRENEQRQIKGVKERKQTEATLRESQRQLELEKTRLCLVLDQMPSAIVIADKQTQRITDINKYYEFIWKLPFKGNTIEEFTQIYQLFHLNGTPYSIEERPIVRSLRGETIAAEEAVFKRGNDSTGYLLVNATPIMDSEGRIVGGIAVHSDITESRELQRKLEEYNKNLEQIVEERTMRLQEAERMAAIGLTARMVGHDLRSPLQLWLTMFTCSSLNYQRCLNMSVTA